MRSPPGLDISANGFMKPFPVLLTWGVIWIVSSSSPSMIASPSDDEVPDSYSIMLELPTELDRPDFSPLVKAPHNELGILLGDSGTLGLFGGLLKRPLRDKKPPLDPTIGEDSGDDSASVE